MFSAGILSLRPELPAEPADHGGQHPGPADADRQNPAYRARRKRSNHALSEPASANPSVRARPTPARALLAPPSDGRQSLGQDASASGDQALHNGWSCFVWFG